MSCVYLVGGWRGRRKDVRSSVRGLCLLERGVHLNLPYRCLLVPQVGIDGEYRQGDLLMGGA